MEKLGAGIEFIFSSYKRTAAVLIIFGLALAIPVTLSFLGQQQDIRQRASDDDDFIEKASACPPLGDVKQDDIIDEDDYEEAEDIIDDLEEGKEEVNPEDIAEREEQKKRADVSGDGQVTDGDTSLIALFLLGKINTFPACQIQTAESTPSPSVSPPNTCGDNVCQNAACLSTNCPVPESESNCPQDCPPTPTVVLATPTTATVNVDTQTHLNLSFRLAGIGNSTNSAIILNKQPLRIQRNVQIKLINSQSQELPTLIGIATLDPGSGLFTVRIRLPNSIPSGAYIVKVRLDYTLWKQIPGIQNITGGTESTLLPIDLVSGDVDQNNEINLTDYTLFLACYRGDCGGFSTISDEPSREFGAAIDFNDDGKIDEPDLNIFYFGFSRRRGD